MRRRLYFLIPDLALTRQIVDELLLARIDDRHIHVLGNDSEALKGLPEATLLQTSDVVHGLELGLIVGGATGVISGLIASFGPAADIMGAGLVLVCALAGALVGAWASGMVSTSIRNSRLKAFEKAMEQGEFLLIADIPKERVGEICTLVKTHREAHLEGSEPTIPAFP